MVQAHDGHVGGQRDVSAPTLWWYTRHTSTLHHARQRLAWSPPGIIQCLPGVHSMPERCFCFLPRPSAETNEMCSYLNVRFPYQIHHCSIPIYRLCKGMLKIFGIPFITLEWKPFWEYKLCCNKVGATCSDNLSEIAIFYNVNIKHKAKLHKFEYCRIPIIAYRGLLRTMLQFTCP